jgi:formate-dependent nitrite reductase cytochrome c552 subunit
MSESNEPRAGYYVSTQDRPAFVTNLSSEEIDEVFELMRQDQRRWYPVSNGNGKHGNDNGMKVNQAVDKASDPESSDSNDQAS